VGVTTPVCVWPLGAMLGEGPVWWQDSLWFTDIKQDRLHRFTLATGETRTWAAPAPIGFLAPVANGHFLAGAKTGLLDFDPETGLFKPLRAVEPDLPDNRLNDGAVDSKGRLWFGSMDDREKSPAGRLYSLEGGELTVRDTGYVITNGPAFSPDGRTLYHTDTLQRRIYAFDLASDGQLSNRRLFVEIEAGAGYPDGPVTDAEGCVWTGMFGGFGVRRYSPAGELLTTVAFPTANVTKIAFGGADLRTAYATTARKGLDAAALAAQPLAGGLFTFRVDVPGLPQTCIPAY